MLGFAVVALDNPKSEVNVGGALRACHVYGVPLMVIRGQRFKRCASDTTKAYRHIPVQEVEDLHASIPFDCVPIAVEITEGATLLPRYHHPERAFYVFGAEDATLGDRVLSWCRDKIMVPTRWSMNLAATVNVVLYDRMAKTLLLNDWREP